MEARHAEVSTREYPRYIFIRFSKEISQSFRNDFVKSIKTKISRIYLIYFAAFTLKYCILT